MEHKTLGDNESINILKDLSLKRLTLKATRDKFFERGYRNKNGILTVPNVAYFKKQNKSKKVIEPKQSITDFELIKMVMKSDLDTKRKFYILEKLIPV